MPNLHTLVYFLLFSYGSRSRVLMGFTYITNYVNFEAVPVIEISLR